MRKFEFHAYPGNEYGEITTKADVTTRDFTETMQAKTWAGRLAKRINGPVDIARAFEPPVQPTRDWSSRYITTAMPSEVHKTGYRFERLD